MKWASSMSLATDSYEAISACLASLKQDLMGADPHLVLVFASLHHRQAFPHLGKEIATGLNAQQVLGCTGGGIVGDGQEVEHRAALSVCAAVLPGVQVQSFHFEDADLPEEIEPEALLQYLDVPAESRFILLPDPFSTRSEQLLRLMDLAFPGTAKIGGLASGGRMAGMHALFVDDRVHTQGTVGLALSGNLRMETVVAQGCRPIGQPMFITSCQDNLLMRLNDRSPREVLRELYQTLDENDQALFRHSLFLGLEMKLKEDAYTQGDFLIRNILSLDPASGAMRIGTQLFETAVAQFHLRDADTSREDLDLRLRDAVTRNGEPAWSGALMFSCLGRGKELYGIPNHDSDAIRHHLGELPVAGFFCNGEIGPVQGQTYLHGYTSSIGLFRPADA